MLPHVVRPVRAAASAAGVAAQLPWDVSVGLALVRTPVVVPKMTPIEQEFKRMSAQIELRDSLKSDFELRCERDERLLQRRRELEAAGKDLSQLDDQIGVTAMQEEADCRAFAERTRQQFRLDDLARWQDSAVTSLRRQLAENLVLLVRQKFGTGNVSPWILPQLGNRDGETLRQTAEKCLGETVASSVNVVINGNAPFYAHRYKYPSALRDKLGRKGNNIFICVGYVRELDAALEFNKDTVQDYRWATRDELLDIMPKNDYRDSLEHLMLR